MLLATKQDLTRIHRELSVFIDLVMESVLRMDKPVKYPPISATLRAIASENQIDLREETASKKLLKDLEQLKKQAPVISISFPEDPAPEVVQKLISWFRQKIDNHILIQVGLQPTIAAGVVLRTKNHQYDFSLRRHLYKNRGKLIDVLTNGVIGAEV